MKAAIFDNITGAIVARWNDPAVTDPSGFPFAPDGYSYAAVSDDEFDSLDSIVNAAGRLSWKWDGSAVVSNPKPGQRPFIVICDSTTRAVVSLDREIPSFVPPGHEWVSVNADDFASISNQQFHDEAMASAAWDCAPDGTVTPRNDTRLNLVVTTQTSGLVNVPHSIDFELQDAFGNTVVVTASRAIKVVTPAGARTVTLSLVNGLATVSPTLQAAGDYRIWSAEPDVYRVSGDVAFNLGEQWS